MEGRFAQNEFARLEPDELHLLRIFILCEGSLREMESALGVSYPTIKSRLAALREKLSLTSRPAGPQAGTPPTPPPEAKGVADVLKDLEEGKITYQEAVGRIKEGAR